MGITSPAASFIRWRANQAQCLTAGVTEISRGSFLQ